LKEVFLASYVVLGKKDKIHENDLGPTPPKRLFSGSRRGK
jgi:hypothetical protein